MKKPFYYKLERYLQYKFPELGIALKPNPDTYFTVSIEVDTIDFDTTLAIESSITDWLNDNGLKGYYYEFDWDRMDETIISDWNTD